MNGILANDGGIGSWRWNWTELCGAEGGIEPLNRETHDLGICFQQLCLQIPVLALIAIISAYYCGKRSVSSSRGYISFYALNIRLIVAIFLAILPVIRAYIILTNGAPPSANDVNIEEINTESEQELSLPDTNTLFDTEDIARKIENGLNRTGVLEKILFANGFYNVNNVMGGSSTEQNYDDILLKLNTKTPSAKPIDYIVAGTEGLAWVVHFCFLLTFRRSNLNPRGPVLLRVLVLLLLCTSSLLLRSHINNTAQDDVLPNLSLGFSISVVILLVLYALTLIPNYGSSRNRDRSRNGEVGERTALLSAPSTSYVRFLEEQDPNYLGTAMEEATMTSILLFHWVTPLMEKGVKGLLRHSDDLYDLPEHLGTSSINQQIDKHMKNMSTTEVNGYRTVAEEIPEARTVRSTSKVSLLRLLHQCFGWQFYAVGVLKFVADCTGFVGPLLLNRLVGFIEDKSEPIYYGYLYAFSMFFSTLFGAFCSAHFTFWMSLVGLKIRTVIVTLVYRKTLHLSKAQLNRSFTFGEIVNFMSTDSDRIVNSCPSFHTFWSIPLQLVVTLYLLYIQIGIAFLAGLSFAIVLIPVNKVIANKIGRLSTKLMESKDQRVRLVAETLRGITAIKLNVWEEHFVRSVLKWRESEIKYLKGRKYLDALCVYFWATTPIVISILTFSTYALLGNQLDAKTVFTSMALLNMLIAPLNAFPWVLNGLTEAWVSVKRIQKLLDIPDLDTTAYYSDPPVGTDIMMKNLTLSMIGRQDLQTTFDVEPNVSSNPSPSSESKKSVTFKDDEIFALKNLNVTIQKGQLIGIMGKIGSGKSLLLDAILAELTLEKGTLAVNAIDKGVGYVKQNAWLQRGTIRDNILFGKAYDYNKYKSVLKACALTDDLNSLPKKDLTGVGESGNTLSGGQKTRIALARAVYADKEIYLLDDILATLDVKVAKHIFQNVVLGLLRGKTRIVCTHQTQYLIHADLVIELSKGAIVKQGRPCDILPDLEDYLLSSESIESDLDVGSIKGLPKEFHELDEGGKDTVLDNEFIEKGTVHLRVYTCYLKAIGRYLAMTIFLSMILMQTSKNITDLWLSYWVTRTNATINSTNSAHPALLASTFDYYDTNSVNYYLTIYGILAILNSVFTLIRAFIFAYGGIQAAISMHKQLLKTIIRAKVQFFDVQPLGRLLNRFSSDTYTVDDSLPFISNILLAQVFGLIGTIIVTVYGLPWIFLILVPLVPIYHWIQNHYRLTSRELKRLSSIALSPLYAHFSETLQGLSTIRAFQVVPRFKQENDLYLDSSQKTQFASIAASQWLALRLQFIGVALLTGVCIMAVMQHQYDIADAGLIGLAISYVLSVTGLLSGVVNAFTETEREMIAVERIKQYLESTSLEPIDGESPPYAWPGQGVVEFKDVVLKYRDYLAPSLKGISFATRPAEKIGIVGRTGAGKSSIFASLFRLAEIASGEILVDNVNIQTLQLYALRSRLSIIPQNPFLFLGTVRENVDPLNQYPDSQVYKALEKCKVHSLVYRLGGLGATLEEGGSNLSAGQRQLFCLARAVLHNAKILCIDEATANVDQETDKSIQTTIKSSFRSATVITIAHRIRTIMHCDRVMVMGDGEVLEFDEPNLLLQNIESHFFHMASQEFSEEE
ncbi:multidrug resistance-associated protein 7 [Orussus abietinus]|uniref:multidrug resistance-associated protein 7 n=1 Tax=Orussus abietinus TaxID=222816 RepID=UPI0006252014|nr:multidrug resistance-associated protein 7 [Orussus abietinus]XP_012285683.1 multidrug resistance-associated protein 7 [Orussus abietinus]XP_012285684.1 multidrug resistance-associated protein 7 [Orussus abietinus]